MYTTVGKILKLINQIAPFEHADDWDNSGLLIGHTSKEVDRIMFVLDVTEETIDEAIEDAIDLIVAHHPLIFKGLKSITTDDRIGKLILKLIKNDIAVIAAHTNIDKSFRYGINQFLGQAMGLDRMAIMAPEGEDYGYGVVGFLESPMQGTEFLALVKHVFNLKQLKTSNYNEQAYVRKVAICSGAASDYIDDALASSADVYITGDLKYHECQKVIGKNMQLYDVGHYESESIYLTYLKDIVDQKIMEQDYDVFTKVTEREKSILNFY